MSLAAPHFLLYAEAAHCADSAACDAGRWRFVLRLPSGETSLEAADDEQETSPERLELLAVIRGLEALSQPSRVTLMSGSRAIRRGLHDGLVNWRENDWQWERYGRLVPVKNSDLWRRLDRLLEYHAVECRPARLEKADDFAPPRSTGKMPVPPDRSVGRMLVAPDQDTGETPVPPNTSGETPVPSRTVRKRGGKTFRIDQAHGVAKQQITSSKSQTNANFKRKNSRIEKETAARFGFWKFTLASLFGAWSLVVGHWQKKH